MSGVALAFRIGARTLVSVRRDLVRIGLSLDDVLAARPPVLPPTRGDGYLVTSLPAALVDAVVADGWLCAVRQRYTRHYADLACDADGGGAVMSATARATLRRKQRRATAAGASVRACRTAAEFDVFHPLARAVSARTYQERLLDAGLPGDAAAVAQLRALAARDALRAWLLLVDGAPVAYVCCTAQGATLRYDHVGHDPAYAALSPGIVLQAAAMRDLTGDRFARFDFTEGEGQHKRLFATAGVPCVDLLLVRPTIANRALLAALSTFDRTVATAKRATAHPRLATLSRRIRR